MIDPFELLRRSRRSGAAASVVAAQPTPEQLARDREDMRARLRNLEFIERGMRYLSPVAAQYHKNADIELTAGLTMEELGVAGKVLQILRRVDSARRKTKQALRQRQEWVACDEMREVDHILAKITLYYTALLRSGIRSKANKHKSRDGRPRKLEGKEEVAQQAVDIAVKRLPPRKRTSRRAINSLAAEILTQGLGFLVFYKNVEHLKLRYPFPPRARK